MKIKFNISGDVGLNYGADGVITVKEGDVKELPDNQALILCKDGIAEQVEKLGVKAKPVKQEEIKEVKAPVVEKKVMTNQEVKDAYNTKKSKRGRPAKKDI